MIKNTHIWLPAYIARHLFKEIKPDSRKTQHIVFCLVDHFEPGWNKPSYETELKRVNRWFSDYPETVRGFADSDGRPPQHTFFYPQEEYRQEHLEKLTELCKLGLGEIEIHLHHDSDTPEGLRNKIEDFKSKLKNQ